MFNTVILLVLARLYRYIEHLYPQLFTLSEARQSLWKIMRTQHLESRLLIYAIHSQEYGGCFATFTEES